MGSSVWRLQTASMLSPRKFVKFCKPLQAVPGSSRDHRRGASLVDQSQSAFDRALDPRGEHA